MMPAKRLGFSYRVLTPSATRGEAGSGLILPRADAFGDARRSRSPASASPSRWTRLKAAFSRDDSPEPGSSEARSAGTEPASFRVAEGVSAKQNHDLKHRAHSNPTLGIIGRDRLVFV